MHRKHPSYGLPISVEKLRSVFPLKAFKKQLILVPACLPSEGSNERGLDRIGRMRSSRQTAITVAAYKIDIANLPGPSLVR